MYKDSGVIFQHIEAHTGNQDIHSIGNEEADKLAVKAIGGQKNKNTDNKPINKPITKTVRNTANTGFSSAFLAFSSWLQLSSLGL